MRQESGVVSKYLKLRYSLCSSLHTKSALCRGYARESTLKIL